MSELPSELIYDRKRGISLPLSEAILLLDKPGGLTSFGVVRQLRKLFGVRKIGHAGTLDPLATGLLICCVGRPATKLIRQFADMNKEYTGTFRLGSTTTTFDADGETVRTNPWEHIESGDLREAMAKFEGPIEQLTPAYSAVKVGGERLYKRARRGEAVARPPRLVDIYDFQKTAHAGADVSFRVLCSKGTYVRTLVHDVGESLGCGAHLVALRRTRIGDFSVDKAFDLQTLHQVIGPSSQLS